MRAISINKIFVLLFLGACYTLIILNPYLTWGRPGYAAMIVLWLAGLLLNSKLKINISFWIYWTILILIGAYSSVVAISFGVIQISLFFGLASMFLLFHATIMWSNWLINNNYDPMIPFYGCMFAVMLNTFVILLQILVPGLQAGIEQYFTPGGNIDFSEGFRLRGMASSGGAALSVLMALACVFLLFEGKLKFTNIILRIGIVLLIFVTMIFVGRTGILLLLIGTSIMSILSMRLSLALIFTSIAGIILINGNSIWDYADFLIQERFETGVLTYSLGFLSEPEGLQNEGTLQVIIAYLLVLPDTIFMALFGSGFYGGNEYNFYSDSGLARVFLAVGYPLGLTLYFIYFRMLTNNFQHRSKIFIVLLFLLFISELKEPLLFIGPAARFLAIYAICVSAYNYRTKYFSRTR